MTIVYSNHVVYILIVCVSWSHPICIIDDPRYMYIKRIFKYFIYDPDNVYLELWTHPDHVHKYGYIHLIQN